MILKLKLFPVSSDVETTARLDGTMLNVNGTDYDLAELPDGATAKHPELGWVTRNGEEYECSIRMGHGPNAPHETRFPEPIVLVNHSGPIELPMYDLPPEPEEVNE